MFSKPKDQLVDATFKVQHKIARKFKPFSYGEFIDMSVKITDSLFENSRRGTKS